MLLKNDVLILRSNSTDFVGRHIRNRGYKVIDPYVGQGNMLSRFLRRIHFNSGFPFVSIWYNKKILKNKVENIIIFETDITADYISWLCSKKEESNIKIWYWNIVKNTINPSLIESEKCEKWSFSSKDCNKYRMKFNPPPYFYEIKFPSNDIIYDIVFIGKDKGRLRMLLEYKKIFEEMGLKVHFHITPDRRWKKGRNHSSRLRYKDSLVLASKSRAVFDYIEINDSGQSMRVMETLFWNKKVITNNKLIKGYDFYMPENIFVLGEDNLENLHKFINTPYKPVDREIVLNYDFDRWLERFYK